MILCQFLRDPFIIVKRVKIVVRNKCIYQLTAEIIKWLAAESVQCSRSTKMSCQVKPYTKDRKVSALPLGSKSDP